VIFVNFRRAWNRVLEACKWLFAEGKRVLAEDFRRTNIDTTHGFCVNGSPMATKSTSKKPAAKAAAKKPAKRKANPALMKPVQPDDVLAAVVGSAPLARGPLTKKIWDYIKKNGLQDQKNKRNINADAKLKAVFNGKSTVTMFEMTKLVNKHIKA